MMYQSPPFIFIPISSSPTPVYHQFQGGMNYVLFTPSMYQLMTTPSITAQTKNNPSKAEEELTKQTSNPPIKNIPPLQNQNLENVNTKNIITNLTRRLIGFLASPECKKMVYHLYPNLEKKQFSKILAFISGLKKKGSDIYVGKRVLMRIWFRTEQSPRNEQFFQILRRVSHYYLENICPTSIIRSKKIRKSLKPAHLQFRRKLLSYLTSHPQQ